MNSKVTLILTGAAAAHENTAGTGFAPGTRNLERPRMFSDIMSAAVEMEAQTKLAPDPVIMPSVPTLHTPHSREQSRSPRRHVDEESFGLTSVHLSHQFGFRDSTLWCWRLVSGQPSCIEIKGSVRRPDQKRSRCCVPTMCLVHLSASRSSRIHTTTDTGHKFFPRMTVPHELQLFVVPSCWNFDQGTAWLLGLVPSSSLISCQAFYG